ncbi:MAG: hypothetical protein RL068_328 [Actinomycetota bacterium]
MNQDRGSLSILLAGYLALALLMTVAGGAVGLALVSHNRIQGITDSAVLYAHDRSVRKGIPTLQKLRVEVVNYLSAAASAKEIEVVSLKVEVFAAESALTLCARHIDPLGFMLHSGLICKNAKAKSFLVP